MSRQNIDIGTTGNDGTGDSIRESFRKVNANFAELYAIFGQGDTIGIINLSDVDIKKRDNLGNTVTPIQPASSLEGYDNHLLVVDGAGEAFNLREIEGGTGISVDVSNPAKITINSTSATLSTDGTPNLGGPLDAALLTIGRLADPTVGAVATFNAVHGPRGVTTTLNQLAVNKKYVDDQIAAISTNSIQQGNSQISVNDIGTGSLTFNVDGTIISTQTSTEITNTVPLYLNDHPGALAGAGTPNGTDDLQAATKYYVDNSSFASEVNLFVATSGDDLQTNTPAGKEGRAFAYAYSTVGAACARAEELILLGREEPGPYRQKLGYTIGLTTTYTTVATNQYAGGNSTTTGYLDATFLLSANRTWIQKEVIAWINYNITNNVTVIDPTVGSVDFSDFTYDNITCERDIGYIIDGMIIDLTVDGNNQAVTAGKSYFRNASARLASGAQLDQTVAAINRAKTLAVTYVLNNTAPPTTYQGLVTQTINLLKVPSVAAKNDTAALFDIITDILTDSTTIGTYLNTVNYGTGVVKITFSNGGIGFVDQGNDTNLDIISGKLIRGMTSGAVGLITRYFANEGSSGFDSIECSLVRAPINFQLGEELEFAEPNIDTQITIRVESGIYYEDYPIKVPQNVTIKGDEFRRVIVRPRDRISQSPWVRTYFYRDGTFDGMQIGALDTGTDYAPAVSITPGDVTGVITMTLASGSATRSWVGKVITGNGGAGVITSVSTNYLTVSVYDNFASVAPITSGNWHIYDTITFGYHYLSDPTDVNSTPKNNKDIDVFLFNDATKLHNLTGQGHGGFMCVLDPAGSIGSKSPYMQSCSGFSQSVNAKAFRGGMFIDGFVGRLQATLNSVDVSRQVLTLGGLTNRRPVAPTAFYKDGYRYQIDYIESWNSSTGIAIVRLNDTTPFPELNPGNTLLVTTSTSGSPGYLTVSSTISLFANMGLQFSGTVFGGVSTSTTYYVKTVLNGTTFSISTSPGGTAFALSSASGSMTLTEQFILPLSITLETPGNKSLLANDFTQVNDLGYGVVATNTGLTEQVSTFTYYCHTAYFALNGGQIRSVAGSNAHGNYGLRAIGSDPTEVPDAVSLANNLVQVARIYRTGTFGSAFTATISGTVMNVSSVSHGTIQVGDTVNGTGVTTCVITSFASGSGSTGTYNISISQTVSSPTAMTSSAYMNANSTDIYIYGYDYNPTAISELEIQHGALSTTISRYEIKTISYLSPSITFGGTPVLKLTLSTSSTDNRVNTGLSSPLTHTQFVTIRVLQNFKLNGIQNVRPVRPSTALQFDNQFNNIYRTIAYNLVESTGETLPSGVAILTTDASYDYVRYSTTTANIRTTDPLNSSKTMGFTVADLRIAIDDLTDQDDISRSNAGDLLLAWSGKVHRVTSYVASAKDLTRNISGITKANPAVVTTSTNHGYANGERVVIENVTGMTAINGTYWITVTAVNQFQLYSDSARTLTVDSSGMSGTASGGTVSRKAPSYITLADVSDKNSPATSPGIATAFYTTGTVNLRAGAPATTTGIITVRISTCRVTSHDFLDIGTGGYNTTNYPSIIYGNPAQAAVQANEVFEETTGRVFYVSTDQFGIFRVGQFFTVDQGTGTVTFSASIALSNLDGLGFKRGVVVAEFSADPNLTNNSSDTVPVQSAIRGYIDKRLGLDHGGLTVSSADLIGPGYLALNGLLAMKANLQMGNFRIQSLADPTSSTDAATKNYVDTQVQNRDEFSELRDVYVHQPVSGDIPVHIGAANAVTNATIAGDLTGTVSYSQTTLTTAITNTLPISGSLVIGSSSGWSLSGAYFRIGNEVFSYSNISPANTLNGITRSLLGTTATTHLAGATVFYLPSAQLNLQIASGTIVDADINSGAAISQSKLSLSDATTTTKGIASFSSTNFAVSSGAVSVKTGGITLGNIQTIGDKSILANFSGASGAVAETTAQTVTQHGLSQMFSSTGVVTLTATGTPLDTFATTTLTSGGTVVNSVVQRDASAFIDALGYKIDGSDILTRSSTTLQVRTPGGVTIISATGAAAATTPVTLTGQFTLGPSSTLSATYATSAGSATSATTASQADALLVNGATYRAASTASGANTVVARDGNADIFARYFQGTATSAFYADLAEWYTSDKEYEPGTVLIFGGSAETTTTNIFGDARLAGVVSTKPGFIMNEGLPGTKVCIALQGRVPCKVVGRVKKGDMLTTAGISGHAAKAIDPRVGTIIGKALEDKDYTESGIIEVAVGRV